MIEHHRLLAFLEEVKRELQQQVKREQYDSWFRGFHVVRLSKQEIEFGVPTGFVRDWLTRNYHSLVADAVQAAGLRMQMIPLELDPSSLRVRFSVHVDPAPAGKPVPAGKFARRGLPASVAESGGLESALVQLEAGGPLPAEDLGAGRGPEQPDLEGSQDADLPIGAESVGTQSVSTQSTSTAGPQKGLGGGPGFPARSEAPASQGGGRTRDSIRELVLNPGYTFDQFVVGPCNRLSHAAALAIGENPGRAYNPLYIHGGVGLGKTHLLQAICQGILKRHRAARVLYVSCEEFTNRFIHSIQSSNLEDFRASFRGADVLVVDDVQFMGGKERTQEEFFHTFNALYNSQKQIVISSDHSPVQATTIEDRIVSRFKWGLVTEIEQPCFETRVAIVKRKARLRGADFDDEISYFIAERMATNIRELEGAVIKVIGFAAIMDRQITLQLVEEALRGSLVPALSHVTLDQITELVTSEFSVTMRDLTGKSRSQPHAMPRQISMFLVRELLSLPFEEIGRRFGGRDHTTVMYSVQKVKDRMSADRMFRDLVNNMVSRLGVPNRHGRSITS